MDQMISAGNPRFFACTGPHPLATVAEAAGCSFPPSEVLLTGLAALETAGPSEISFVGHRRHATALTQTRAGAVLVRPDMQANVPAGSVALVTADPAACWGRVAALFHPAPAVSPGIHPTAVVADAAIVDASAEIGPHAVIEANAEIGPRCRIGPGAVIGAGVVPGPAC